MLILITYDVSFDNEEGAKRLRKLSKECVNYGQRVQNSVFECEIDGGTWRKVKNKLEDIIDPEKDSLRYYYLGNKEKTKIENHGVNRGRDLASDLLLL